MQSEAEQVNAESHGKMTSLACVLFRNDNGMDNFVLGPQDGVSCLVET
jgi:hypothetical protein